jgi:hypothetical protein
LGCEPEHEQKISDIHLPVIELIPKPDPYLISCDTLGKEICGVFKPLKGSRRYKDNYGSYYYRVYDRDYVPLVSNSDVLEIKPTTPPVKPTPILSGNPGTLFWSKQDYQVFQVDKSGALYVRCDCLTNPPEDVFTIGDLYMRCAVNPTPLVVSSK